MAALLVTIKDWPKFNPRTDSKNHSWFRLENNFFTKTFSWSGEEQRLFLYLCSLASQSRSETCKFDSDLASALLKRKTSHILRDLKKLAENSVIELSNGGHNSELLQVTDSITSSYGHTTNERTNVRTNNIEFDFDKIYDEYPLKKGKSKGLEKCEEIITSQELYDRVLEAVRRYVAYLKRENKDPKYILHFSTFMNSWKDWDHPDAGKVKFKSPQVISTPPAQTGPTESYTMNPEKLAELKTVLKNGAHPMPNGDEPPGAA